MMSAQVYRSEALSESGSRLSRWTVPSIIAGVAFVVGCGGAINYEHDDAARTVDRQDAVAVVLPATSPKARSSVEGGDVARDAECVPPSEQVLVESGDSGTAGADEASGTRSVAEASDPLPLPTDQTDVEAAAEIDDTEVAPIAAREVVTTPSSSSAKYPLYGDRSGADLVSHMEATRDAPIAPSLGAALPVSADAVHVDVSAGDDARDGGARDPVRTVRRALELADAGGEIVLHEGVYLEGDLRIRRGGRIGAPLTIRGRPGDRVIIDGSLSRYHGAPGDAWELVDPATDTYRSASNDHGDDIYVGRVRGAGGRGIRLVPYHQDTKRGARGLEDLQSLEQSVTRGARYVGPGLYNDNGWLYLRLTPVASRVMHGAQVPVPASTDPNELDIELSDRYTIFRVEAPHVEFADLELRGALHGAIVEGKAFDVGFDGVEFSVGTTGVAVKEGADDVRVERSDFNGDFPAHVAWSDMKGRDGQSKPAFHWSLRAAGVKADGASRVRITDSRFFDVFDGMVITGSSDVLVADNVGRFIDDMVQLGSDVVRVEIRDNRVAGAGPSHYGKGDSPEPGTVYIHGNVIDSTPALLWGKSDPQRILRAAYSGWRGVRPFPAHDRANLESGAPWKLYNNTVVFDGTEMSPGIELWEHRNRTGQAHEVYNNVLVNVGAGAFGRDLAVDENELYDGNVYWRAGNASGPLFAKITDGQRRVDYVRLKDFVGSPIHKASRAFYAPGWETSGIEADPGLDATYRPVGLNGPAAVTPVAVPAHFPGPVRDFRGARRPL